MSSSTPPTSIPHSPARPSLTPVFWLWLATAIVTFSAAFEQLILPYLLSRTAKAARSKRLFEGIHYQRLVRQTPALVWHVARVDLKAPGLAFLVTPPTTGGSRALLADTTSGFLQRYQLQIAVNGDFFEPWMAKGPLFYYPRVGEPVDVRGFAVSMGVSYGLRRPKGKTLFASCTQRLSFNQPRRICQAISGIPLLRRGKRHRFRFQKRHPRTAIGLDQKEGTLIPMVVDGRQPHYSVGVTLDELTQLMHDQGAYDAIALDGGGSSVMVTASKRGPRLLSTPIHGRVIGWERPVANHFGIYALP